MENKTKGVGDELISNKQKTRKCKFKYYTYLFILDS